MVHLPAYINLPEELHTKPSKIHSFQAVLGDLVKRAGDVVGALLGLLVLSPVFALIAILIKRDSDGPIFFWGHRMGKDGKEFKILKFRTMFETKASYAGPGVTCKDDQRITPLGRWLRSTKINELPQLWNVLVGEMSMVGPRPEDPEIASTWPYEARREILSVRPGITSPASILYHDEEDQLSAADLMEDYFKNILPDKMRLDRLYIRNRSFSSDLDIIFWTLVIIIPHLAKVKIHEGYFFAGPVSRLIRRHLSWFLVDLIISLGAAGSAGLVWRTQVPLNWGLLNLVIMSAVLALLFSGVNSITGLNKVFWSRATTEDAINLMLSSGLVTLAILVFNHLQKVFGWLPYPAIPTSMIFTIGLLAQIGFLAARYRLRLFTSVASRWLTWRGNVLAFGERVLIIGSGDGSQFATWLLRRGMFRYAFSIVGIVDDDDPSKKGMRVDGCKILGGCGDVPTLIAKYDVGVVLFTTSNIAPETLNYILDNIKIHNVRAVFLDDIQRVLYEQLVQPVTTLDYSLWLNVSSQRV